MSGSDFLWWLNEIWFDLTHLDTADLPSLIFRLVLLVLLVFAGTFLLRVAAAVLGGLLRSYVLPAVQLVWQVLTAPVRLPWRLTRRILSGIRRQRSSVQQEQREQAAQLKREAEARERELAVQRELEAVRKAIDGD